MRRVPLSKNQFALVDDEDFDWAIQFQWHFMSSGTGRIVGYAVRSIGDGQVVRMHRELLGVTDLNIVVDHRDGYGLNNQRHNLRVATQQQNRRNSATRQDAQHKYKGVFQNKENHGGRFGARIGYNGRPIYLGMFDSREEAAEAYNKAAVEMFGEFAKLNEIPPLFWPWIGYANGKYRNRFRSETRGREFPGVGQGKPEFYDPEGD